MGGFLRGLFNVNRGCVIHVLRHGQGAKDG